MRRRARSRATSSTPPAALQRGFHQHRRRLQRLVAGRNRRRPGADRLPAHCAARPMCCAKRSTRSCRTSGRPIIRQPRMRGVRSDRTSREATAYPGSSDAAHRHRERRPHPCLYADRLPAFSASAAPPLPLSRYACIRKPTRCSPRRGTAIPLGKPPPATIRSSRCDARRALGPPRAAVPAQPREHLSAGRRRRLGDGGSRLRQRGSIAAGPPCSRARCGM